MQETGSTISFIAVLLIAFGKFFRSMFPGIQLNCLMDQMQLKKEEILAKLKLRLTDMGKIIYRQQGSSKDHSLFPIEFIDIVEILLEHPAIKTLFLVIRKVIVHLVGSVSFVHSTKY